MHKRIDLGKEIAPVLSSRELVRELEKRIADKKVILDFKNVEFISHSFAHELLTHSGGESSSEREGMKARNL